MESNVLAGLEAELVKIGNSIASWRSDEDARAVLEPTQFKTGADRKAHDLICKSIGDFFPGDIILSEEDSEFNNQRPDKYWLIDPIDGTASWYDGFDGFVTQIAFIENSQPVYGAVYAPVLKKLWTAHKGNGAFLNDVKLSSSPVTSSEKLVLVDNYPQPQRISKTICDNVKDIKYIESGSLGLKSCLVADGTADLFVKDVVIRDWDIAPIAIIIGEVGGVICNLSGNEIRFEGSFDNNEGLIVARDWSAANIAIKVANKYYNNRDYK